jgi:hypothetical protein
MSKDEVTIERLERAFALAAYLIELDGPQVVPLFQRLERELIAKKAEMAAMDRAKQLLESYRTQPAVAGMLEFTNRGAA